MNSRIDLTLPEWAFLDGQSHLGDQLEGRILLQHLQSYTIIEFADATSLPELSPHLKFREFIYKTIFGLEERHLLIVHFSLAGSVELDWIQERAIEFYKKFLDWQDASLIIEETAGEN